MNWLCLLVITNNVFGSSEKMCPAPLKIIAERWIRHPPIGDDRSREVLAEDFRGNITFASLQQYYCKNMPLIIEPGRNPLKGFLLIILSSVLQCRTYN